MPYDVTLITVRPGTTPKALREMPVRNTGHACGPAIDERGGNKFASGWQAFECGPPFDWGPDCSLGTPIFAVVARRLGCPKPQIGGIFAGTESAAKEEEGHGYVYRTRLLL